LEPENFWTWKEHTRLNLRFKEKILKGFSKQWKLLLQQRQDEARWCGVDVLTGGSQKECA